VLENQEKQGLFFAVIFYPVKQPRPCLFIHYLHLG